MVLRATLEKKEEKERVRLALLRATLHLAAEHGFASLGLREVSREAGIAPTSFYRHFADMEELGMALIRELAGRVMRGLGERALTASRDDVVTTLVSAMLDALVRDPELIRFMVAERTGAFSGFRALLRGEHAALARSVHAAGTGVTLDASAPPPAAADAAVSLLFEASARALDEPPSRRAALIDPLVGAIRQLLAADRGSGAPA
jgi:TetR/AcrR family transcriptional regulator, fatty acid biosynthesis regulator